MELHAGAWTYSNFPASGLLLRLFPLLEMPFPYHVPLAKSILCFKASRKHHLLQEVFLGLSWKSSMLPGTSESLNYSSPSPALSLLRGVAVTGIHIFSLFDSLRESLCQIAISSQ